MTAPASSSSSSMPPPQNLAVLKAVVIILGVLFVVGFLALIVALVMRSSDAVDEAPVIGGEPAAALSVALPSGAQNIVSSVGANGLSVQFTRATQPDVTHVWVIDPATGAVISKIELVSASAPN